MTIFIGGAWPYTNESLHLGHVAALLPGDVLARYFRQKGEEVLYVSGSDCHGTPIAIRANRERVTPGSIADRYHEEFCQCFERLGFTYDIYTRTDRPEHRAVVQEAFKRLLDKGLIYEKNVQQTFCTNCNMFLPDRYIEGVCPHCGGSARGDQCENCSGILEPEELMERRCGVCGSTPITRDSKHFYLALSALQETLKAYAKKAKGWRPNAVGLTRRYLSEGLQDRAVTRDLDWGVDVPVEGFEGKKVYVWVDAVLGYLSASIQWAKESGKDWERFWKGAVTAYYIHGKDNIPFHTLILPALLHGLGGLHLPDRIISSEHLAIEGNKFSKSRNWAIWAADILDRYQPDSVRYFLLVNGPESRDSNFSWNEFIGRHNSELLGVFGNLVNRSLVFIERYLDGEVPAGRMDSELKKRLEALYGTVGRNIEAGEFKAALDSIFAFIRSVNKYFDAEQPWITLKTDPAACRNTLYGCVQAIANLAVLLEPFIPFSCCGIREFLGMSDNSWSYKEVRPQTKITNLRILFERIDKSRIGEEAARLGRPDTPGALRQ